MKMFGELDLETQMEGCRFSIGIRNSHDKSLRLGLTAGMRVFVCSNMAFSGDFTPVLAKHTKSFNLIDTLSVGVDRKVSNGRRLSRHRPLNGFVNLVPATPTDNSQFRLRGIRQHRKQLEHISVWVTEIERCSGHPSKHSRFVGRLPPQVERNNIGCSKTRSGVQQVRELRAKG